MQLNDFIKKGIFVTLCAWFLLYCFFPRYEFVDHDTKFDRITGKMEIKNAYAEGWYTR